MSTTAWVSLIICVYIASTFICKALLNRAVKAIPELKNYIEQTPMMETAFNYVVFIPILNTGIIVFITYVQIKYFLKRILGNPKKTEE